MTTHTRIIKRASLVNQKIAIEEARASERERCVKAILEDNFPVYASEAPKEWFAEGRRRAIEVIKKLK